MSRLISEQIEFFREQIVNRRFSDKTIRILELVVSTTDVQSLIYSRSVLRDLLRSEGKRVLQELSGKDAYHKLFVVDFFVRAFALVGDVESCLALKYEALSLREHESPSDYSMRVLCEEWITFSEDLLENGHYSIALKGLKNALFSIECGNSPASHSDALMITKVKGLKRRAEELVSPHSVQAKASNSQKRKVISLEQNENAQLRSSCPLPPASMVFRNGLRMRNSCRLRSIQEMVHRIG
ncbi:protein DOUBLE-STRAND BREAK FORMATION [Wolffia australiana]